VPEDGIGDITSVLTILGGRVVHADGDFGWLAPDVPEAMPDWSPVRSFGGYQSASLPDPLAGSAALASACGCGTSCGVHGHAHGRAWAPSVPVSDDRSFWGALGCSCWAF
jgi:hypothetical protein